MVVYASIGTHTGGGGGEFLRKFAVFLLIARNAGPR